MSAGWFATVTRGRDSSLFRVTLYRPVFPGSTTYLPAEHLDLRCDVFTASDRAKKWLVERGFRTVGTPVEIEIGSIRGHRHDLEECASTRDHLA